MVMLCTNVLICLLWCVYSIKTLYYTVYLTVKMYSTVGYVQDSAVDWYRVDGIQQLYGTV